MEQYELLNQIDSPNDVKKLSESELKRLCSEIRHEIITTISKTGGHLSLSLIHI